MRIIDSHTHIGNKLNFHMPVKTLIDSMDTHQIDFSLTACIEAVEVDHDLVMLPDQISSIALGEVALEQIEPFSNRLGLLLWLKPNKEACVEEHYDWINKHREKIFALKFHPYHSKLAFNDRKMYAYLDMATYFKLPIVTHTANDKYSHPINVYEVSQLYKDLNIVMVHMGLGTDHQEAIQLIKRRDNLFGDSTWVGKESLLKAFDTLGAEKILFGTDNPIDGIETLKHESYAKFCLEQLAAHIGNRSYERFMGLNAIELFKLDFIF